jgi:hypothetical protein
MRNFRLLLLASVALFIAFKTLPAPAADAQSPALIVASHLGIILNRPIRAAAPELEMRAGLWHALEPRLDLVLDANAQTLWARLQQ